MATARRVDAAMIEHRMNLLESSISGCPAGNTKFLVHRVEMLQEKIDEIESKVPNTKVNRDVAKKIGALLSSNSASLKDASAKISLIGASRAHFDKIISDLLMVKELSRHAGGGDFEGVLEKCTAPMEALENRFADISRRVKRETAEVDALLDQYETTVNLLSLKCAEWDEALEDMED